MLNQLTRSAPAPASSPPAPPPRRRRRWAFPALVGLGAGAGIAVAGVLVSALPDDRSPAPVVPAHVTPDPPSAATRSASLVIEDEIDKAIANRRRAAAEVVVTEPAGLDPVDMSDVGSSPDRPAYLIIQDEIDRALAERERAARHGG